MPGEPIAFLQDNPAHGILSAEQFRDALSIDRPDDDITYSKKVSRTALALLDLHSGVVTQIPETDDDFPMSWAPDGTHLLVGRVDPYQGSLFLWTWNRSTGAWSQVSKERAGLGAGIADGPIRLVWHGIQLGAGGKKTGVIWINTDERGDQIVPNTQGCMTPDLSSDGRTIVFAKRDPHSKLDSVIFTATLGSPEVHPVTRGSHPRFSRDGKWIVFQREMLSGNSDIWMMRTDGGSKHQITKTDYVEEFPAISPDGRFVVYASARGDVTESHLFVARVSDGVEQEVTHSGQASRPVW
ncbi:MAG TPA: hypothetical protein VEN47_09935 [Myxococcota bacterium]|nr:hypothetical protein [Myxococcota bacterium]